MSADKNKFETDILTNLLGDLEIFSKSPNGIDKLRELIIEQAVRGKLVRQNNNDEPASTLIERIILEKSKLLKDKKIKKTKALLDISSEDIPFDIPKMWEWARLGNIGNIFNGNSISVKVKQEKYTDIEGLPYIATKDVGYGFDNLNYNNGISIPLDEPKFKTAKKSSILICAEGGSAGKKCGITDQVICFGNKLYANEPYDDIHSKYILYVYLSPSFKHQFSEAMTGIIGGISLANFNQLLAPLPPLEEQKRIVTKVDELMVLCDKLEKQQRQQANTLLQANTSSIDVLLNPKNQQSSFDKNWQRIANHFNTLYGCSLPMPETTGRKKKYLVGLQNLNLLRAFIYQLGITGRIVQHKSNVDVDSLIKSFEEDISIGLTPAKLKKTKAIFLEKENLEYTIFNIPNHWSFRNLDKIATGFAYGTSSKSSPSGVMPVLRMGNIQNGKLDWNKLVYTDDKVDIEKYQLTRGDVLFNRTNSNVLVGKTAVYDGYQPAIYAGYLIKVQCVDLLLKPEYLNLCLNSPYGRSWSWAVKNDGISQSNINAQKLSKFVIPLPPLEEQKRIVAKVDKLMELCDKLEEQLTQSYNQAEKLMETTVKALVA